jgi:hypothetical protein
LAADPVGFAVFMKRYFLKTFPNLIGAAIVLAGISNSEGADVSAYLVAKGRLYSQTSAAAPAPKSSGPFGFIAHVEGDVSAITEVTLNTPSPFLQSVPLSDNGNSYEFTLPADSLSQLNSFTPDGQYTFTIDSDNDGLSVAALNLSSSAFPDIPQISNFQAAQSVSADADFTLNFNAYNGSGGNDRYILTISDSSTEVFTVEGKGGSVVIPAGTFVPDTDYDATLTFVHEVQSDTSSYPGATGTAAVFSETEFKLSTGAGGGGGNDTTAPILFFTSPQNTATNVSVNATVTFTFSEAMANTQSIEWSPNVNTAALSYAWINPLTLAVTSRGAFPANAIVTWRLNPTAGNPANFRDVAGNPLATAAFLGSFTTGAAPSTNPCDQNPGDDGRGFGNISKVVQYVQTNNAAPVLNIETAASFNATYRGASNQNVTAVSVNGPGGNLALTNLFGFFLASRSFPTPAALEAAFPAGNYTVTANGAGAATVALGSTGQIPVPQINNLTALASMDVTKDFVLNFAPFTAAGASGGIFISINSTDGEGEFHAPDPCIPRDLPNTATSVLIPANTFKAGQKYSGSISFSRSSFDTNAIPSTTVSASVSATTTFEFTPGGTNQPAQPAWTSFTRNADGTITYTITGKAGLSIGIEASDNVMGGWTQLSTAVLTTGSHQFTVDPRAQNKRFYRARVL